MTHFIFSIESFVNLTIVAVNRAVCFISFFSLDFFSLNFNQTSKKSWGRKKEWETKIKTNYTVSKSIERHKAIPSSSVNYSWLLISFSHRWYIIGIIIIITTILFYDFFFFFLFCFILWINVQLKVLYKSILWVQSGKWERKFISQFLCMK